MHLSAINVTNSIGQLKYAAFENDFYMVVMFSLSWEIVSYVFLSMLVNFFYGNRCIQALSYSFFLFNKKNVGFLPSGNFGGKWGDSIKREHYTDSRQRSFPRYDIIVSSEGEWRRKWQPTPVFQFSGKSHGWRSLPWGHKESDTTERLHFTSLLKEKKTKRFG